MEYGVPTRGFQCIGDGEHDKHMGTYNGQGSKEEGVCKPYSTPYLCLAIGAQDVSVLGVMVADGWNDGSMHHKCCSLWAIAFRCNPTRLATCEGLPAVEATAGRHWLCAATGGAGVELRCAK
jgi:hypothetical protein